MLRKPRMYMAYRPSHVIYRGNNCDTCFYTDYDYLFYIECLQEAYR
jgi:putative transposase